MSQDDLDRLINERRLVNEAFDDIQVAGFLIKALGAFDDAQVNDDLRTTRAESVYEPNEDEAELARQLANAIESLTLGLPLIRTWIVRTRPSIEAHLPIRR